MGCRITSLKKTKTVSLRDRGGQTMLEYIIVFAVFMGFIVALSLLLYAIRQNGVRVLDLVSSEYP